ncbi:hypothetical protein EZ242_17520 [Ramlibacter rhizophilus]|uniref:HTH rpiR-type domain-containing protein n=1 Tax=Ramlibacter rhizophilus TaxID=1781167 RepID=A0A4Z0BE30_9BURK|nr:hypothetical protein [Ramlibacter rhizophilus]TFY97552.1 hypothetical protein EZ242_17520 [Ramlibacter rhizophilus]
MLDRIRSMGPRLPPAERRVGELALKDPAAFSRWPVSEIAKRSGVSTPTVVRFCRSLGYDGLTDLKERLARMTSTEPPHGR